MKLNFFSRIYLAITDFRLYPYVVQKEKFITAFSYFLCFMLAVSFILSANATVKIISWLYEFSDTYYDKISDYKIANGKLDIDENVDIDFFGVRIYSDDTKEYDKDLITSIESGNFKISILAFKDAFAVGNSKYGYASFNYNDLNINLTKEYTFQLINSSLDSAFFRLSLVGIISCSIFISYFITRICYVLVITLMLLFLGLVFRTKYKFFDYMKVAFYVITLPTITEIIALLFIGELNEYATITYYLLSYVYMFYAIRALKLDSIIISTQEKIMNMKSEVEKANDILNNDKSNDEKKENKDDKENRDENEK